MDYHKLLHNKELVTKRMEELYLKDDFKINKEYIKSIHKYLFKGVLPDSGRYRDYNIRRHEVILNEESVNYEDYHTIDTYLDMAMQEMKGCHFDELNEEEKINYIINIINNIWIIHPFNDGNTRTVTVFITKYLNSLGYDIDTEYFRRNSEYFRDSIVRGIYANESYGVIPDNRPLYIFLDNIMNNKQNRLRADMLIVKEMFNYQPQNNIKTKRKVLNK